MKLFKAIVKHSGVCEGHFFKAGIETILPESTIKALGDDVKVLGEHIDEGIRTVENTYDKDVKKPFLDRMIHGNETVTK